MKLVLLRGVNDKCIDALNLIDGGDITQVTFDYTCKLARNYSSSTLRKDKGSRLLPKKTIGVSRVEPSNLLYNMKEDIIGHLETQLDTLPPS